MDDNAVNAVMEEAPASKKPKRRARPLAEMAEAAKGEVKGIFCPKCAGQQFKTSKTMWVAKGIRRYRVCDHCGYSWPTVES
jgi:Zn ribbon nucleic-acid-binding protein